MSHPKGVPEYQALAQFRFLIRKFLNNSEKAARSVGLEPQQYMGLLALRGLPSGKEPSIRNLATRLQIEHHSTVELVDRMEKRGLFRRERSTEDARTVLIHVTSLGERLLRRLVRHRIAELRVSAPALTRALQSVLTSASRDRSQQQFKPLAGERIDLLAENFHNNGSQRLSYPLVTDASRSQTPRFLTRTSCNIWTVECCQFGFNEWEITRWTLSSSLRRRPLRSHQFA
jgi:DNA-binding MarR family transcriptional regulator